jgi:hypothetical protein
VKRFIACAAVALTACAAFAADASWGIGGSGGLYLHEQDITLADPMVSVISRETSVPMTVAGFVSSPYLELLAGGGISVLGHQLKAVTTDAGTETLIDEGAGVTRGFLSLGIKAKYPFAIGLSTLSPFVGLRVDADVWAVDARGAGIPDAGQNRPWLSGGLALDVPFSYRGFVRTELSVGWRPLTAQERETFQNVTHAGFNAFWLTMEPALSVYVGRRF